MSIEKFYNSWSASYDADRNLTRDLAGTVLRELLADKRFNTIVETGCGTGGNTIFLASLCSSLIALDFSEGMLSVAQAKASTDELASRITFVQSDLTTPWPVQSGSADCVVCTLVLEHIDELVPVFREAWRVLNRGGAFLVSELHPERQLLGGKATFQSEGRQIEIPAFNHSEQQFTEAACSAGFSEFTIRSHRHPADGDKSPRIFSMFCTK